MVGWQRHLQSLIRQVGKRVEHNNYTATASYLTSRLPVKSGSLHRLWKQCSADIYPRPFYQYLQQMGISSSRTFLAEETPISSPLSPTLALGTGRTDTEEEKKVVSKQDTVQAVLKGIKQINNLKPSPTSMTSPKKVNLVAALVRGMRVEDALMQLQVTVKRASKTVYQVIHSARANATHNHGLDPERLLVSEAFVGKGFFQKRISYHSKMRHGMKIRPECRLTIVVREITPEEEAEIARLRVNKFLKLTKREQRLVPHQLIESTPIWDRKGKKAKSGNSEMAA
ncbi:hypothetical protein ACFE04_003268 [Oxalis oulophora]